MIGARPSNREAAPASQTISTLENPRLEFAFALTLRFTRVQKIENTPDGGTGSAVYVDEGVFEGSAPQRPRGPQLGRRLRWFRPDDTAVFDARYMLEEEDGTLILICNRGFLWGRAPDTMARLRRWAFEGGEPVPPEDYYLRAQPSFECPIGKHDWLTRHVFIGVGERRRDGNHVRYYAVT